MVDPGKFCLFFMLIVTTGLPLIPAPWALSRPRSASNMSDASERAAGESYSVLSLEKLLAPLPADKPQLSGAIAKLKGLAHPVQAKATTGRINPVLAFLGINPPQALDQMEQAFQRGASPQIAYALRHMLQVCTECHATSAKPTWAALQPIARITLIELADFYKFSGRPNDALLYYEKILVTRGAASSRPDIWDRAALNVIALAIESSGSPYTFVDVTSNLLQSGALSKKQKDLLSFWRTTGKAWGLERQPPSRPIELLEHARVLIVNGDINNRLMPDSGLVQYARAMFELRRIQQNGTLEQKTRAFQMAGELREKIPMQGVWLGAEDFYEACIRASPQSMDATRCWSLLSSLSQRDPRFALDAETNQQLQALLH